MDCLDGIKEIADDSVSLIIADPPYFLGMTHNGQKGTFEDLEIAKPFFCQLAQEFSRVLNDNGEFYIFTDWRGYAFYYPIFANVLPVRNLIVWDKKSGCGNFYAYTYELIIYGCMNNRINKKGTNIWREPGFNSGAKTTNGKKVHPTQKPVELIERMIQNQKDIPKGILLDPFLGSGTTAVAAIRQEYPYIGFEISPRYFNTAQRRIKEAMECNEYVQKEKGVSCA